MKSPMPLKIFKVTLSGCSSALLDPINASYVSSDAHGVHFFDADYVMTATYPVGTIAVSVDALKPQCDPAMFAATGELVAFEPEPRIKIDTVNITVAAGTEPETIGAMLTGLMDRRDNATLN